MKVTGGFISNSSTSSFVVSKTLMTAEQIQLFKDFIYEVEEDDFYAEEEEFYFGGSGENYDSGKYFDKLKEIGVERKYIWSDHS